MTQFGLGSELSEDFIAIATAAQQFTVRITGRQGEAGSGIIWQPDGVILTNAHVVQGAPLQVQLADGRTLPAIVTQQDRHRDLARLQVQATDLPCVTLADSDQVRVGEWVIAVGNPYGLTGAVTTGMIHAKGTPSSPTRHWIQADIALAPGNSGGPLLNAKGEVIGMNTMIVNGRGFAIASNRIQHWLADLGEEAYLGVTLQPVRLRQQYRVRYGWLITAVAPQSPAAHGQLQPGDVIVGVRGRQFQSVPELPRILAHSKPGDDLPLTILRGEQRYGVTVVLCSKNLAATAA